MGGRRSRRVNGSKEEEVGGAHTATVLHEFQCTTSAGIDFQISIKSSTATVHEGAQKDH